MKSKEQMISEFRAGQAKMNSINDRDIERMKDWMEQNIKNGCEKLLAVSNALNGRPNEDRLIDDEFMFAVIMFARIGFCKVLDRKIEHWKEEEKG